MQKNLCQIQNHNQSPIMRICFNKKCQMNRVCCSMCFFEFHKDHSEQTIDIEGVLQYIENQSQQPVDQQVCSDQTLEQLIYVQNYLEELQRLISEEVERFNLQNAQYVCKVIGNKYAQKLGSSKLQNNSKGIHIQKYFMNLFLNKDNPIFELKGHKDDVMRIAFSNNSKYLISGSNDKTVIVWDVIQTKQLFQLNSESSVQGVAINGDNTILASNSYDGNIRIWNLKIQNLLCIHKAHDHGAGIQFSNDHKMLVSSGNNGKIRLWSLAELNNQSKLLQIRKFKTATTCIWTVLFSPCSQFIISMSNEDREVKIIDSQSGVVVKLFQSKATNENTLVQVAISQEMEIIAYGEDNNVIVWRQK